MVTGYKKAFCWGCKFLLLFIVFSGCRPSAIVETHIVKKSPEAYSFMSKNTRLLIFPVLTRNLSAMDGECNASEETESMVADFFQKLTIVPFADLCLASIGEASMSTLINFSNTYFSDAMIDSINALEIADLSLEAKLTHILMFRIEKNRAWKNIKGSSNQSMLLRGSLYELATKKIIFEFISAGKTTQNEKNKNVEPDVLVTMLVSESIKQLPYDPERAFKESSTPDF
jgi:hypothetical protein